MAKTTLRAYNREIEGMLDRNQVDEVIAHCRHILKTYPKYLDTYRLLGKAYLEMKNNAAAADIFGRVLACVPNDFVSNVGMSLIRDEENKLDDAIMHMERAFEIQPSNAAVQSELQRLSVRRDGSAPSRIRMTRGALAHMYVKGELYPQAIAEIKSVLKEDSGRIDMEALQARAYYRSGQKQEAVEVATSILRRYLFCYDANAILVDILGAEKPDYIAENRQRVTELDPYAAYVKGSVLDSSDAPDSAIMIERLVWDGQSVSMPADWLETRGVSLQAPQEEPDWLKTSLEATETTLPPDGETAYRMDASAQTEEEIPEFLRDAGWGKSTGAFDESKVSLTDDETLPPTAAVPLAAADMPDWLKAMAPSEPEKTPGTDEPMPDWMDRIDPSILPGATGTVATNEEPDWLSELGGASTGAAQAASAFTDQPDWLKGLDSAPAEPVQPAAASSDEPDWLKGLGGTSAETAQPSAFTDQPDWLKGLDSTPTEPAQPVSVPSDMPDWLKGLDSTPAEPAAVSSDIPDWSKELDSAPAEPVQPAAASSDMPDWLKGLDSAPAETAQPAAAFNDQPGTLDQAPVEAEPAPSMPATDDLSFLDQPSEQPQEQTLASTPSAPALDTSNLSSQAEDDAFAWLESLAVKQGSTEGLLVKPEDRLAEEPDWVKQAKSLTTGELTQTPASAPVAETPQAVEPPAGTIEDLGKSEKELEDSFAWLESLAVKQGSTEGLLVKPEDRTESEPDWVKQAKEISEPLTPPVQEEMPQPASPMDTAMWLKSLDAEGPVTEPVQSPADDEVTSWLQKLDAETPVEETSGEQPVAETDSWLKNLETETPVSEPQQPAASDETTLWLKSLDEAEKPAEAEEPAQEAAGLPDWMQKLEAEEAAPAAESVAPSEEAGSSSDWSSETTIEEPRRYDTGSLPGWLQDVDAGEPAATQEELPAWLRDETGEAVAEPTRIEPTRADDWQPMEVQAVDETPEVKPEVVEEKPQPAPKPKKAAEPKKPEPRPATPVSTYQEPVTRKGTGMLTQTVDMVLGQARNELNRSNIPGALETYAKLIKKGRHLDEIVFDLREASYRYPVEVSIWQTLGDAYMRGNRLQDALDAYTKAEELLR